MPMRNLYISKISELKEHLDERFPSPVETIVFIDAFTTGDWWGEDVPRLIERSLESTHPLNVTFVNTRDVAYEAGGSAVCNDLLTPAGVKTRYVCKQLVNGPHRATHTKPEPGVDHITLTRVIPRSPTLNTTPSPKSLEPQEEASSKKCTIC